MKIILSVCFLLFALPGNGQHRIGDFMAYGNNQGLPASLYYSVLQSSDGYLWIGSSSGLVRFDGKRYKVFFSAYADTNSLADNIIVDLAEDDQQNLWMAGFYQGLTKYNLKTGDIQRYSRLSDDQTPGYGINQLLINETGLWVATAGRGLAHYLPEQDSFEFFIPDPQKPHDGSHRESNHLTDFVMDHSDNNIMWISAFDGLYRFDQKQNSFERFHTMNPESKEHILSFLAVESDNSDHIYLGTWYNGLMRFHKGTKQFEIFPYSLADPPHSSHYQVLDIYNKDDSTLYMASRNLGLLSFNIKTQTIRPLLTNEMLPGGSSEIDIQHISFTPDGGLFVGGNYYIYQQHPSFDRFGKTLFFSGNVEFVVEDVVYDHHRNGYWVATINTGNIVFLDKAMISIQYFNAEKKIKFQCMDIAIDGKRRVWAINDFSQLLKLNEENNTFTSSHGIKALEPIADKIRRIESDINGNLWLATSNQLFYFDIKTNLLEGYNLPDPDIGYWNDITLVAGHHDDAWIATDKGLFHGTRGENKLTHLVPDDKNRTGIANLIIKSMTVDHAGNPWLGFESDGVQVVNHRNHQVISSYNLDDGLPGMQINYMATDSAGRIWVGTSAGLALFNPKSKAGIWQLFNREDGIKRDYIDRPIMTTKDGKLFFNIERGVSWIDIAEEAALKNYKLVLHLTSIMIDGQPYRQDLLPDYFPSVEISYASKEVRIEFAAMDWLHSSRTKYFYRIEGINAKDEWIENNEAIILLSGMKPGKYTLQIYAVNGDEIKSNEINLPVTISPPFWQRWWFFAIISLGIIGLSYVIYRYRIGQLKKLQTMRNTISTNLHDDIGASLSNIHILTVLTQRNISNKETATSYITKAGDEIQRISEALSDIVWNISPKYDDMDNLFVRMKRYAADMLEGKNIKAELIFPEQSDKISMPMDQRRDFYLIFKEGVNNLVKYAGATEGKVRVSVDHKIISLEISDNGKGFDEHSVQAGNGMQNMKQRAAKWKSHLQIKSSPGKGTSILLDMIVH